MKRTYPDGPRIKLALAIVGQLLPRWFPPDPLGFAVRIAQKFGDIAHFNFSGLHVYQLNHPDLVRQVLVDQPEKFNKPKRVKEGFRPLAGTGLFTSDGTLWKQQRKLIQPAFHHRQLTTYADVITAHTGRMMDSFVDGEIRDIHADMLKLTFGIVVKSLFGAELFGADRASETGEISPLMLAVLDATNQRLNMLLRIPTWAPTPRNLREKRALNRLDAIVENLIRTRRASGESRDDLLSALISAVDDSGACMSDRQLRDEVMTLFLAGHETTASALTWTWYLLSRHPEVEAKLVDELQSVLAGRAPSLADLPNLPYMEMVIRETMRLYPPAPGVAREPIEDVRLGGYDVPKGSIITINMYSLHRDDRFFPDPERFDPERFAPGWEERIPRYAYLPFGSGPRVCIGNSFAMMEARLVLTTVARQYRLSLASDEPVKPVQLVTLRPGGPVRMRITRRTR